VCAKKTYLDMVRALIREYKNFFLDPGLKIAKSSSFWEIFRNFKQTKYRESLELECLLDFFKFASELFFTFFLCRLKHGCFASLKKIICHSTGFIIWEMISM
jgi:hypothetical protein